MDSTIPTIRYPSSEEIDEDNDDEDEDENVIGRIRVLSHGRTIAADSFIENRALCAHIAFDFAAAFVCSAFTFPVIIRLTLCSGQDHENRSSRECENRQRSERVHAGMR